MNEKCYGCHNCKHWRRNVSNDVLVIYGVCNKVQTESSSEYIDRNRPMAYISSYTNQRLMTNEDYFCNSYEIGANNNGNA